MNTIHNSELIEEFLSALKSCPKKEKECWIVLIYSNLCSIWDVFYFIYSNFPEDMITYAFIILGKGNIYT